MDGITPSVVIGRRPTYGPVAVQFGRDEDIVAGVAATEPLDAIEPLAEVQARLVTGPDDAGNPVRVHGPPANHAHQFRGQEQKVCERYPGNAQAVDRTETPLRQLFCRPVRRLAPED